MRSPVGAGIVAGLIAGVVFGLMMTMMMAPTPEGGQMPMMAMVAKIVGSQSLAVGWAYHLFNSEIIGAIGGWLLLMPMFLGMPAFAPLMMPEMRPVATGSLMGHLIYGLILGGGFVALRRRGAREEDAATRLRRAA